MEIFYEQLRQVEVEKHDSHAQRLHNEHLIQSSTASAHVAPQTVHDDDVFWPKHCLEEDDFWSDFTFRPSLLIFTGFSFDVL